jgi:hypothetical protein
MVLNGVVVFVIALAIVIVLVNLGIVSQGSEHTSFGG